MGNSNNWFLWQHVFLFLLRCYNRKFFHSRGITHSFSLRENISLSSLFLFPSFFDPLFLASLPPFIGTSLTLISTTVLLPTKLSKIFFFTLSVSSPPWSWSSNFYGVFVLFKLSHMHSMRQGLGENPLINVNVTIFNLLVCSGSFSWFQVSSGSHTSIIRAPCLG